MIIFGWGDKKEKDFGDTLPLICSNCNNDVYYRLVKVKKSFTLFFIPVLSYETIHYLLCPICSRGKKLSSSEIDDAIEMNKITKKFLNKKSKTARYKKEVKKYQKKLSIN